MTPADRVLNVAIRKLCENEGIDFPYSVVLHEDCKGDIWYQRGVDVVYLRPYWVNEYARDMGMVELCQFIVSRVQELATWEPVYHEPVTTLVSDGREAQFFDAEGEVSKPISVKLTRKNPPKKKGVVDATNIPLDQVVAWYLKNIKGE